jgi:Transposase, Mutator family
MTEERLALIELLQKSGDGDFLRAVAEAVLQILMEADVEGLIGAGRHERSAERLNYQRLPRPQSRYPARAAQPAHPQAAPGFVLPALPGAAQDR